nr:TolC family protein [Syntrophaceae bacterium]
MNGKRLLCLLLIFSFLCGCTMAPKYERPEAPVPAQWPAGKAYPPAENAAAEKTAPLPWRDFIPDARLQEIIQTALANNRDLRLAVLTVEKARAYYGIGRVSLLPTVNAAGTWYQERIPADLSASGNAYTAEKYSVNLGITSWELDFFGRIRSLRDAALEEYMASREALRGAEVLLVST